jgi:hypothetical protein
MPLGRSGGTFYPADGSDSSRSALLKEYGFEEEFTELLKGQYGKTGFPKPIKRYQLSLEMYDLSLEEPYFWTLDSFKDDFPIVEKLEDAFAASENSAFFGITQQRLGAQQDKISQFLATTGKMIKELFQMVRELRILDERLGYYKDSDAQLAKEFKERGKSAEITLKGIFIDLVQGGGKSAASVYGMARELEFITLPDLFFDAPPFKSAGELENYVKAMGENFNRNVLRVLERHLRQYHEWKKRTHAEHRNRKRFMLSYLKQHFEIVQMYINWVKPYLRHVRKLHMKQKSMDSVDIVSAFEGSMLDIEVLARKRDPSGMNGCVLMTFNYRTRPEMKVVQEGYQRGPVHIGRYEMNFRAYLWDDEQVERYKRLKEKETLLLMGEISASVEEAMHALGKDLDWYLKEAGGKEEEKEKEEPQERSFMQTLFGDFYHAKKPKQINASSRKAKREAREIAEAQEGAKKSLQPHILFFAWNIYHTFKKAHRMISW